MTLSRGLIPFQSQNQSPEMLLKILQISHINACVGVSFLEKLQARGL